MLFPHVENRQPLSGDAASMSSRRGHPAAPPGFELVVADRFCRGAISFSLNVGHLLTRQGGGFIQDGEMAGHKGAVHCCTVLDDNWLLSAGSDNCLKLWDLSRLNCIASTEASHSGWITCCSIVPGGAMVAAASESCGGGGGGGSGNVGVIGITGSADGKVRIWDIATLRCRGVLSGHGEWVMCCCAFSALVRTQDFKEPVSRCMVLSGDNAGIIKLWDLGTLKVSFDCIVLAMILIPHRLLHC